MKKYRTSIKEEDYIVSIRQIPSEEWNRFNTRMYQLNIEAHKKFIGSQKSSLDAFVK